MGGDGASRSSGRRRGARAIVAACITLGVAGIASWYGCSVYDSSLLVPAADSGPPLDGPIADAGGDTRSAMDAGPDAAALVCPEVFPPPAPAADDPSDAGDQTFVVAVHTIDLGVGDEAGVATRIGYDLDKIYTCCDGGAESCKAATTGATHCDNLDGRDNAAGGLFEALASVDPSEFNTSSIGQRLQDGAYSILIQVLDYNGTPNDTQVTAALYASAGVEGDAGALWNGMDSWTLEDSFVVVPDASPVLPTHFDANAYVSDGTLVIHVNFPLELGTSNTSTFDINLTAGIATGQVVPSPNGGWSLANGVIAGRWNNAALLSSLQTLAINGAALCPGSGGYYGVIKSAVCQYSDIMTDPTQDLSGSTCDAVSLAIGFTADPALLGGVVPTPVKSSLCYPDGGAPDGAPDDCTKQ